MLNHHNYIFVLRISISFGGLVVRVLVLHLCDSGSNPKFGSYFFFFSFFFFFFLLVTNS